VRIEAIHPDRVRQVWDLVRPGIGEIRSLCSEPWLPEDVYSRLIGNQAALYLFFSPEFRGFSVLEVCSDAEGKYLNVWLLHFVHGCDVNRDELLHWLDTTGRSCGCSSARFTSPRAWAQMLKGSFKERSVNYERKL